MFTKKITAIVIAAILPLSANAGWGLDDIKKSVKPDCANSKDKAKCNQKAIANTAIKAGALIAASKLIYDLFIDFKTEEVNSEKEVKEAYLKSNKSLPKKPTVTFYKTNVDPGKIVPVGKPTTINSQLTVVAGSKSSNVDIEEKIVFFDNDDDTKEVRSLVKKVNEKTKQAGAFENSFTFTLPVGMPQGVYKIKTSLIVDGVETAPQDNEMQVVLNVFEDRSYQIAAVRY
ncbi:hypothetical protein [Colwellia psychrerythraea]|uniref:Uncharacterized protein n=1 Tax=Colwellia psychrerythraea TaxID=28229 RepID=A0A099KYR8_COLPS|nr:hypothetical protein [Colwellia psychrerythraea]KGJ94793.1 hypothetical protein GAB14E_2027 [Colwellia psychrerythraea]